MTVWSERKEASNAKNLRRAVTKTPHKDAPNNWNAVVTGIARDEPTNSNALNVMIYGVSLH
jgi:hypothetical protein